MARLRSAPTAQVETQTKGTTRPALKDRTNTTRQKGPIYDDDGHTEGLVKDARPKRTRAKKAEPNEVEFIMAGGLGQAGSDGKTTSQDEPAPTADELAKSDEQRLPPAKANRRPPRMTRKVVQDEAQSKAIEDIGKRMQASSRNETATKRKTVPKTVKNAAPSSDSLPRQPAAHRRSNISTAERSEFSLSPSPPPPGKLSSVKRSSLAQPGSALRPQGTPAVESSILALKNFKRRPRQPSMLQMVQQRTASARPSAVHMHAVEDQNVFDLEDVEGDEDDFAPEAEGTPLHVSKAGRKPAETTKSAPNKTQRRTSTAASSKLLSRKRKSDELNHSSSALDALEAKRQKSIDPELRDESLAAFRRSQSARRSSSERHFTPQPQVTSDIQVIHSSPSSTPPTEHSSPTGRHPSLDPDVAVPSTEKERYDVRYAPLNDLGDDEDQIVRNPTLAEPASSSPLPAEDRVPATQRTDIMADPLTQISPPRPEPREKSKKKVKPLNTATLQALLPKRRQPPKARRRKSEYDIESESDDNTPLDTSHLEEDEDELGGRVRRQTKSMAPSKGKKGTAAKTKSRLSKAASTNRQPSAAPTRKSSVRPAKKKSQKKTYGRGNPSDKENEGDNFETVDENDDSALPDTSISMYEAAQSKELEAAKKKFADLDNWEMEFESMSVEEGRSSSQAWR